MKADCCGHHYLLKQWWGIPKAEQKETRLKLLVQFLQLAIDLGMISGRPTDNYPQILKCGPRSDTMTLRRPCSLKTCCRKITVVWMAKKWYSSTSWSYIWSGIGELEPQSHWRNYLVIQLPNATFPAEGGSSKKALSPALESVVWQWIWTHNFPVHNGAQSSERADMLKV